jgi:hypothetical protein
MDDGSKEKTGGILLHTNAFTYEEVLLLVCTLKRNFNIMSKPRKKYNRYIIYINSKSLPLVVKLVKNHIHPNFLYKIVPSPPPRYGGLGSISPRTNIGSRGENRNYLII